MYSSVYDKHNWSPLISNSCANEKINARLNSTSRLSKDNHEIQVTDPEVLETWEFYTSGALSWLTAMPYLDTELASAACFRTMSETISGLTREKDSGTPTSLKKAAAVKSGHSGLKETPLPVVLTEAKYLGEQSRHGIPNMCSTYLHSHLCKGENVMLLTCVNVGKCISI